MEFIAALVRRLTVVVLSEVLKPERGCVADVTTLILKAGNLQAFELVARTFVELGNLLEFLGDRIAKWGGDVLGLEERELIYRNRGLVSKGVREPTIQDFLLKLVVAHGGVVQNLLLVHELRDIGRLQIT